MSEFISEEAEKTVKTKELATYLNIAESTIRKYSQVLESAGIVFLKDAKGGRLFKKQDFEHFHNLIRAREEMKMGLEVAADYVSTQYKSGIYNMSAPQSVQPYQDGDSTEMVSREEVERIVQKSFEEMAAGMVPVQKFEELEKRNLLMDTELKLIKEKLDDAVEFIQKLEEKPEKKSFLKRLFG